jgi:coiled-coil-helix-coiled-coil-helix domain-containing protein 10
MIMQGMMFGTGSAIAHRAVDAVAGPRTINVEHGDSKAPDAMPQAAPMNPNAAPQAAAANDVCKDFSVDLANCLQNNTGDIGACKLYFDMLAQCQRDSSSNQQWS